MRIFDSLLQSLKVDVKHTYFSSRSGRTLRGVSPVSTRSIVNRRIILTQFERGLWNAAEVSNVPGNDYDFGHPTDYVVLYEFNHEFTDYLIDAEFENEVTLSKSLKAELLTHLGKALGEQTAYWNLWETEEHDDIVEIYGILQNKADDIVELYSEPRIVPVAAARGLRAELSIDLATGFDLNKEEDRQEVREQLQKRKPKLLVACPPCTKFSPLQNLRLHPERLAEEWDEAVQHVEFAMDMLDEQLDRGDHGLYEHPELATSWKLEKVQKHLSHDEVLLIKSHLCRFGLRVGEFLRRKSTLFATTSDTIAVNLQKLCQCQDLHEPLVGGSAHFAQVYPPLLVKAIVDGLVQEWVDSQKGKPPRLPELADLLQWSEELDARDEFQWREFHGCAILVLQRPQSFPRNGPAHRTVRWTWAINPCDGKWLQLERARSGKPCNLEVKYDKVIVLYCFPDFQEIYAAGDEGRVTAGEKGMVLRAHVNLGHPQLKEFVRLLKAAGTRPDIIQYVLKEFSCEGCLKEKRQPSRLPAATPRTYDFNVVIGIDLLFLTGASPREEHPVLNGTCVGTLYSTFTMVHPTRRASALVWAAFLKCWLRVFGSPSFIIMDQGLEFQGQFLDGLEDHGIQPILIDRDAPYQNGVTERRGGLFKEVYYKTRELLQPSDVSEVENMIHEVSWALQTMTNRSGYSPAQRVFGRQPTIAMEVINDTGQYELSHTQDAAWRRSEETRSAARKALMEVDSRERVNRAVRARPRRAREDHRFSEGEPVYVWRQGRRGTHAKVGPCFVILEKGDTVWVTRRGELWKCNKSQVFPMGNLEKQGLEAIPAELLRAKERIRFDSEKLGYIDVEREGEPPEDQDVPVQEPVERLQLPQPIVRRVPPTPRAPPEGLRTPNPSTPAPSTPLPIARAPSTPSLQPREAPPTVEPEVQPSKKARIQESDADELWRASVENQSRKSEPSSSSQTASSSRSSAAEQLCEWSRYDFEARRYRGSNSKGPLWGDVVRRITLDIDSNRVIKDEAISGEIPVKQLYDKLPTGTKNIQTVLIYKKVQGHPDPGIPCSDAEPGQTAPVPQDRTRQEDARLIDTGLKRSLDDDQNNERQTQRSKIFGEWRANDITIWGKKCRYPVVANVRDLAAFQKVKTSDCVFFTATGDFTFHGLTKQSGKELNEKELLPQELVIFDAAKVTEINNLINSNAIEMITNEQQLEEIRTKYPYRIMPSRFILVKKASEVGEDWKAKARWILLGHKDPDAMQLERYAPTPSSTTIMLCFQVIASMKFKMFIMDVSSAFGQSDHHEREQGPLYASMPPTGIPGYGKTTLIRVLTAVYGLVNAPAVWRKTVRRLLLELGYTESIFDPCLYYLKMKPNEYHPEERYGVAGVVLLDVDDFCQGGNQRHAGLMAELRTKLKFGKWREVYNGSADYIGRTLKQLSNFEIQVSMQRYIEEKLRPVNLTKERLKQKNDLLTTQEITWLRGVGGSLLWVGKEGRPDVGAACAMAMSWSSNGPTVDHIIAANKTVAELKSTPDVHIRVLPIDPSKGIWMSIADASMANVENKSQGGFILAYVDSIILKGEPADFSVNSWKSHRLKRVVKATLGSEALAMDDALAEVEWIRALWHEVMDPNSIVSDGSRFGDEQSVLVVRQLDEDESETVSSIRITDDSEGVHATDAKALFDLLNRRSGNAGHCRRAQIDVSVIYVSAKTLKVTTFWVPGGSMLADPLTKRLGNSALLRRHLRLAKYALTKLGSQKLEELAASHERSP